MPLIQIQSLPPAVNVNRTAVLVAVNRAVARAASIPTATVWSTWTLIEPGHYVEGERSTDEQPTGTHPPIVRIIAFMGRRPEIIEAMLDAAATTLGNLVCDGEKNVFAVYEEAQPGRVFTGGQVRTPALTGAPQITQPVATMNEPLLYYIPGTCALAELICLEWIGKPYRLCKLTREDRQSETYLSINPHGAVPAMRFGDRMMVENAALLLHLADANPDAQLAPAAGTPERDEVHFWLSYIGSRYHVAHYPIFKGPRFTPREELHAHLSEVAVEAVGAELDFLNERLAGREFAVGSSRTVVDAYFVATGRWARRFFDYAERCPEFDRYLNGLAAEPGIARALEIEGGAIEGPDGALLGHVPLG